MPSTNKVSSTRGTSQAFVKISATNEPPPSDTLDYIRLTQLHPHCNRILAFKIRNEMRGRINFLTMENDPNIGFMLLSDVRHINLGERGIEDFATLSNDRRFSITEEERYSTHIFIKKMEQEEDRSLQQTKTAISFVNAAYHDIVGSSTSIIEQRKCIAFSLVQTPEDLQKTKKDFVEGNYVEVSELQIRHATKQEKKWVNAQKSRLTNSF